eukprot:9056022-Karenia_brevis.AAC.1
MLADVQEESMKVGLLLHPEKTKILTSTTVRTGRNAANHVDVGNMKIQVLPHEGCTKYLGRMISFDRPQETELEHRTKQAWKNFMLHKSEFTNKAYSLRCRLRLFDAVVTPTILYGSSSWSLTKDLQGKLQRTQRRMLRM